MQCTNTNSWSETRVEKQGCAADRMLVAAWSLFGLLKKIAQRFHASVSMKERLQDVIESCSVVLPSVRE